MASFKIVPQDGNDHRLIDELGYFNQSYDRINAAFAFVTKSGLETLKEKISKSFEGDTEQRWVVSISDGITDPSALRLLNRRKSTQVRVMDGNEALSNFNFRTNPRFHSKMLWFIDGKSHDIVLGSNNLTRTGLRGNWEMSIILRDMEMGENRSTIDLVEEWWERIWNAAEVCDEDFIEDYEKRKATSADEQKPDFLQATGDPDTNLHEAKYLWVNVGSVSGGSQNQVDIPNYCSRFFSREDRTFGEGDKIKVTISYEGESHSGRTVSWNQKGMTRISLPTEVKNIPDLEDYYIIFEKKDGNRFGMNPVSDEDRDVLDSFFQRSQEIGHVKEAKSGRAYGWV